MIKLRKELSVVSGLLCLLLTLGILPVLVWHSWSVLSGIARVSLLGYAVADLALWSAARWSATGPTGLIRSVALACKAGLAALLLFCAASVIALHAGDQRKAAAADRAGAAEAKRLETIAEHAERLAATSGRAVSREFMRTAGTSTAGASLLSAETSTADAWLSGLPDWWPSIGIVAVPPLAGLAVLVLLSAVITLTTGGDATTRETREDDQVEDLPERRIGYTTPARDYVNFRRSAPAPTTAPTGTACGGTGDQVEGVRYERKKDGRVEAWLPDASTPRGKRYLTSFSGALTPAEQSERVRAAIARKGATVCTS